MAGAPGLPDITSPEFLIGVVAVGIVVHVCATFVSKGLSMGLSKISRKWAARVAARDARHRQLLEHLRSNPKEVEHLYRSAILNWLEGLVWMVVSVLLYVMSGPFGYRHGLLWAVLFVVTLSVRHLWIAITCQYAWKEAEDVATERTLARFKANELA
jgi:hypothetical protein